MSAPGLIDEVTSLLDVMCRSTTVKGIQVSAISVDGGSEIHVASGEAHDGTELSIDRLYWGYCLARPVVVIGIAAFAARCGIDVGDDLGDHVGDSKWATWTLDDIVNHRAGLGHPTYVDWKLADGEERGRLAGVVRPSARTEYGSVAPAMVLRSLYDALAEDGRPLETWILEEMLSPAGLDDDLVVAPCDQREVWNGRLAATEEVGGSGAAIPLLSELLEGQVLADAGVEGGLLVNARGMSRFAAAVLRAARGELLSGLPPPTVVRRLLSTGGPARWDHQLQKSCRFAGGFMADLGDMDIASSASELALGHSGGLSSSCFLLDRLTGVALAVTMSTVTEPRRNAQTRRHLVDAVLSLVDPVSSS